MYLIHFCFTPWLYNFSSDAVHILYSSISGTWILVGLIAEIDFHLKSLHKLTSKTSPRHIHENNSTKVDKTCFPLEIFAIWRHLPLQQILLESHTYGPHFWRTLHIVNCFWIHFPQHFRVNCFMCPSCLFYSMVSSCFWSSGIQAMKQSCRNAFAFKED